MTKTKYIMVQDRVAELEKKIILYQHWFDNPNVKDRITEAWKIARCSPTNDRQGKLINLQN